MTADRRSRVRTWFRGRSGDRGTSLVEYAVVLALVVVVSIPAIQRITSNASDEVDNQATCVSMRPPPPECQLKAIPPSPPSTGTPVDPGGGGPIDPDPDDPCDDCPDEPEPYSVATLVSVPCSVGGIPQPCAVRDPVTNLWQTQIAVEVSQDDDSGGAPIAGARVIFRYRITAPSSPQYYYGECITDGAGICSHTWEVPFTDAAQVTAQVFQIVSDPAFGDDPLPSSLVFTAPA